MAHVIIGFAEALPAPEVVFSLRRAGHVVSAFARSAKLPLRHIIDGELSVIPAPEANVSAAADALSRIIHRSSAPDYILPLDDAGLWLVGKVVADDPRNLGASSKQLAFALDKTLQMAAAQRAGIAVPQTLLLRANTVSNHSIQFPSIAKPSLAIHEYRNRLTKGPFALLTNPSDVDSLRRFQEHNPADMLIQPFIPGQGEGVFGFSTGEGVTAWSGHKRLRMMNPHGSGSSACVAHIPDQKTCEVVQSFLKDANWRGPFMVELLRDSNGTLWFIELNGRMWGSLALARRQGFEYPAWAVSAAQDRTFKPAPSAVHVPTPLRHLGRDIVHLLFVARGPNHDEYRRNWPSFWTSTKAVFAPTHLRNFYNYDRDFPTFFLRDALWTIIKALGR